MCVCGGEVDQGECERRIEVFVKCKKNGGGGGWVGGSGLRGRGVRVDVSKEVKFL